ncbi:MAG: AsmA-like C-terminal region-containing protein, partial [Ferruginibacter sp.]
MKKVLYISLKVLKILLLLIVVLYAGIYFYIKANKTNIIKQVTERVSEKLNGTLTIENADISLLKKFPGVAVVLSNVSLTDSIFAQHKHAFFAAEEVFVNLNIFKLIKKDDPLTGLALRNANIYFYTDTSGYTNTYLLKGKKDPAGGPKKTSTDINLKNIELQNVRFILDDGKREKLHDFDLKNLSVKLNDDGDLLKINTDATVLINSLAFNLPKGTFLKSATFNGEFKLTYGKESQVLSFDSINVKIAGRPFNLTGKFDLGDKNPAFSLNVYAPGILLDDVKKLLPNRIAKSISIVGLNKPIDAVAKLTGPLRGGEPYIYAQWKVEHSDMTTPFLDFADASFTGFFTNEVTKGLPRYDPNSVVAINNLRAKWRGLPVESKKIEILNLEKPTLTCDLTSSFALAELNNIIQTNSIQLTSGNAAMALNYKGPIEKNNNTNSFLNGNISFKDGSMLYARRGVELKKVNGNLAFQNSDVYIQNIKCNVLGNSIVMNGTAKNVLTLINSEPNRVKIDYKIFSPALNLNAFTFLLKKPISVKRKVNNDGKSFGDMAVKIDDLLEKSTIEVALNATQLTYKKFVANNAKASVTLLQDRYMMNNVSMQAAGGSMNINGQLLNTSNNYHTANINADVKNVDVKKLFASFNNFGQDGISYENLEGQLTAKVNSVINIKDNGEVLPSSANGAVSFSLKNGALNNFEPIKKIQNFIFKKRDFENIRFAELKDKIKIENGGFKFNRMEIQSTVLTLFVEGVYSKKDGSDLSIQIPLTNLKK